jgi:hypothetical protein
MKVQFDSNTRTDKNRQCITGGIFYCRDSAGFSVSASNKLLCNLTGQCFEIGNKNIPPNRWRTAVSQSAIFKFIVFYKVIWLAIPKGHFLTRLAQFRSTFSSNKVFVR